MILHFGMLLTQNHAQRLNTHSVCRGYNWYKMHISMALLPSVQVAQALFIWACMCMCVVHVKDSNIRRSVSLISCTWSILLCGMYTVIDWWPNALFRHCFVCRTTDLSWCVCPKNVFSICEHVEWMWNSLRFRWCTGMPVYAMMSCWLVMYWWLVINTPMLSDWHGYLVPQY